MTDNLENKKAIKDVQATSDEAARLLASLESESKHEDSTLLRQKSVNKTKFASPATSIDAQPTPDARGCIGAGILLLGLFVIIAFANYSQQTIGQSIGTDKSPPSVVKPKKEYMYASQTQKRFYDKTIIKANNAVLKREHESAIMSLQTLKSDKYKNLIDLNHGLINNKIIQAKKNIAYLDQPGKFKYWERSDYGVQWFDKGTGSHFRVFFAYSRKCKNPLVTFRISKESGSSNYKTYKVRPRENTSTLLVPFLFEGYQHINVLDFVCN